MWYRWSLGLSKVNKHLEFQSVAPGDWDPITPNQKFVLFGTGPYRPAEPGSGPCLCRYCTVGFFPIFLNIKRQTMG